MNGNTWIFSDDATRYLAAIAESKVQGTSEIQLIKRLRSEISPEQVSQLMTLHELRLRGGRKFTKASQMYFTRIQLEQASSESVARYKARRFARFGTVADLCCGIGGDSVMLSQVARLDLVDTDETALAMAFENVSVYGKQATPWLQTAESFDVSRVDAFHLDPDRRPDHQNSIHGKRTVLTDYFSPDTEQIQKLARTNPNFALKLAPATPALPGDFEIEFVGHQRECKQQVLWSGELNSGSVVRATVLGNSDDTSESFAGVTNRPGHHIENAVIPSQPMAYVYDPHSCLLASGLTPRFAAEHELAILCSRSHYMTSDQLVTSKLVSPYRVQDVIKSDLRQITRYLKQGNIGKLDIKKRGGDEELYQKLSRLKLRGDNSLTMILSGTPDGFRAIACHRIDVGSVQP